jgi:hypothetical protein
MLVLALCAAVLYAGADNDEQPALRTEHALFAFVLITSLWLLSIAAVSLLFIIPMAEFMFAARRWPESKAVASGDSADADSQLAA